MYDHEFHSPSLAYDPVIEKSPPDDPVLVQWARETVFGVIAKYDKASETTTRYRVKHQTDVGKLTTARGRVYRALHKLRVAYTSNIHENAIEDDEIHLTVAARNLAALQLLEELDRHSAAYCGAAPSCKGSGQQRREPGRRGGGRRSTRK